MKVKLQLFSFALAIILLAVLVGWAGQTAWQKLNQLRRNFRAVQTESFHLAEHVEASILNLNETALRFDLRKDPADKAQFHKQSVALKEWIKSQKSSVTTRREWDLLNQMEVAFEAYLMRTISVLNERARVGSVPSPTEVLERVENKTQMLDLCAQLAAAERVGLNQFVSDSYRTMGRLQQVLAALVVLIAFLGFTTTRL